MPTVFNGRRLPSGILYHKRTLNFGPQRTPLSQLLAEPRNLVCVFSIMLGSYWSKRDINFSILDTSAKQILKKNVKIAKVISEFIVSNNATRELYVSYGRLIYPQ